MDLKVKFLSFVEREIRIFNDSHYLLMSDINVRGVEILQYICKTNGNNLVFIIDTRDLITILIKNYKVVRRTTKLDL